VTYIMMTADVGHVGKCSLTSYPGRHAQDNDYYDYTNLLIDI